MSRYIDVEPMRDDWLNAVNENIFCPNDVLDSIDSQPDADVEPVKHAHWNGIEYDSYADGYPVYDKWECSKCGNEISTEDPPKYCCDCGAKMDESVKQ